MWTSGAEEQRGRMEWEHVCVCRQLEAMQSWIPKPGRVVHQSVLLPGRGAWGMGIQNHFNIPTSVANNLRGIQTRFSPVNSLLNLGLDCLELLLQLLFGRQHALVTVPHQPVEPDLGPHPLPETCRTAHFAMSGGRARQDEVGPGAFRITAVYRGPWPPHCCGTHSHLKRR